MTYADVIMRFFYEAAPSIEAPAEVKFEAVAAEVFGTKQRRFGPMPSPEVQVGIREVIRKNEVLQFFIAWGSRKQEDGAPLDVAEFTAFKQLACLAHGLARYGKRCLFAFRVEDLTDRYLFGLNGVHQSNDYTDQLVGLGRLLLPDVATFGFESKYTDYATFASHAETYAPVFYAYLSGRSAGAALAEIGWQGVIPPEQQKYYLDAYQTLWPGRDHLWELAKYFAATLARVKLNATAAPLLDYVQICFTHPVPGNPIARNRLYYRTIPDRYTHAHKSPWLARAYLVVDDNGHVVPRFVERNYPSTPEKRCNVDGNTPELVPQTVDLNGVEVYAPYTVR